MDLKLENIHLTFSNKRIFKDLCLDISSGEKLVVSGASGAGKSSLLHLLLGFIKADSGRLIVDQKEVEGNDFVALRKQIAWLPQDLSLQIDQVKDLLLYPFTFSGNKSMHPSEEDVHLMLDKFSLDPSILKKSTSDISGGEKQRILLVSCVLQKKPLILLDEPSSSLDKNVKIVVADFFHQLVGQTVISASHDQYWIKHAQKKLNLDTYHE